MAAHAALTAKQISVLEMRYHLECIRTETQLKKAGYEDRIREHCEHFKKIVALNPECVHYNLTLYGTFEVNGIHFRAEVKADKDYSQTTLLVFALEQDAPLPIFQTLLDAGAEIAPETVLSILFTQRPLPIKINDVNAFITLIAEKNRDDISRELITRGLLTEKQISFIVSNKVTVFHDENPSEVFSSQSPSSNHPKSNGSVVLSGLSNFFQGISDRIQHGSPVVINSQNLGPTFPGNN